MPKPDVIVVQPTQVDFPLFRYQIRKYRKHFNNIIVIFSESYGAKYNFSTGIKKFMENDHIIFIDSVNAPGDWRHNSVHAARPYIESNNVLFLEQDFIIGDNFDTLLRLLEPAFDTIIGFKCPTGRLHPAFLFVPSKLITDESNFAVSLPNHDHFGIFSESILSTDLVFVPMDILLWMGQCEHLRGLTSNYELLIQGKNPSYNIERFKQYNQKLLGIDIEISSEFNEIIKKGANL